MRKPKVRRRLHRCQCAGCGEHPSGRVAEGHKTINRVMAGFDETALRRYAGLLALQLGRGGVQRAHEITGLSRVTIRAGRNEISRTDHTQRVRRAGASQPALAKNAHHSAARAGARQNG